MGKDGLLEKILGLLDDPRVEVRCAAALVLGAALAPGGGGAARGPASRPGGRPRRTKAAGAGARATSSAGRDDAARTTRALAAALDDANAAVRRFALEALQAAGARGIAADLVPLLGAEDEELRALAERLLATQGAQADAALTRALAGDGAAPIRRRAAELLVERPTAAALEALLARTADAEIGEHVVALLRARIVDGSDAAPRELLGARAAAELKRVAGRRIAAADAARAAGLLRVIGYLADPRTLPTLVGHARAGRPTAVRIAAIAGMRRILAAGAKGKALEEAVGALLEHADDEAAEVARAAVDTLRGAQIPEALARRFDSLAKARHPEARRLATERAAGLLGRAATPKLIERLLGDDPGLRDAAAHALAASPDAAGPLGRALLEAPTEEAVRRLAAALRPHAERTPPAVVQAIADRARRDEGPVAAALLEALAPLSPVAHADALLDRAAALATSGRLAEAWAAARPLAARGVELAPERRLAIAVLGIRASGRSLRAGRAADPVASQLVALARTGFPVARRLAAVPELDLEDLFTLGFGLVESTDALEQELGAELLGLVVEQQPRGKLGIAAKNKLRLAGEWEE